MEKERLKRFKRIEAILDRAKQVNEYDYNYVMNNLRKSEVQENKKKERLKKFRKNNIKWKNKLELFKRNREEKYKENHEKLVISMKTKTNRNSNDNSRNESFTSLDNTSGVEVDIKKAKINIENCQKKDEEKRLKLQDSINSKLERISKNNQLIKLSVKIKFHEKFESYKANLDRLKELEEEKLNKFKQLEMDKSERFKLYNDYLEDQKKKQKAIKKKEKQKTEEIDEKIKTMQEVQEEKRKELEDKLAQGRKKVNQYNLIRMNSLEKKVNSGLKRFNENSKLLNSNRDSQNKAILQKETNVVRKSIAKENSFDMSRNNQQEQTMITQIEVDRMMTDIYSKLKVLRGFSIYKKPEEERKNLYLEIKHQEEEQKKKEEEEAKMKQDKN